MSMDVARIFQRGGHTDSYIGYSPNCHLNIVSCLLTKRLTKGGVTGTPGPPPPLATPLIMRILYQRFFFVEVLVSIEKRWNENCSHHDRSSVCLIVFFQRK